MAKLKLNYAGIVTGVVVGAADEALERMDAKAVPPRTEALKSYRDYFRIGATVLGLAAGFISPKYRAYGDDLAIAALPLLVKSVSKVVMAETTASRVYGRVRSPARGIVRGPGGVSARQPEFDDVRMV